MEKISPMKRCIAKWTKKDRVGYLFIFPAVLVLFVFTIIPLVISFIISLTNLDIFLAWPQFVGLDNFKRTLGDERVWNAFKNTFLLCGDIGAHSAYCGAGTGLLAV